MLLYFLQWDNGFLQDQGEAYSTFTFSQKLYLVLTDHQWFSRNPLTSSITYCNTMNQCLLVVYYLRSAIILYSIFCILETLWFISYSIFIDRIKHSILYNKCQCFLLQLSLLFTLKILYLFYKCMTILTRKNCFLNVYK